MFSRKSLKSGSMPMVIFISILLLIGALAFPMRTSLGQGVDEYVLRGWVGVFDPAMHLYTLRIEYTDGTHHDTSMPPIAHRWFIHKLDAETWTTAMDLPVVIAAAYRESPSAVQRDFGTFHNVPGFMTPFAQAPVAYSVSFLRDLVRAHVNLADYGGPAIPLSVANVAKFPDQRLQIDTLSDGNTLKQCSPGQIPPEAQHLVSAAFSKR